MTPCHADVIYEKVRSENPELSPQEAINHAALAKNSEVNRSGFSALQLVMGQNPLFPGLAEVTPASTNLDSCSKAMRALKQIDDARVKFREFDANERLKKLRSQKINPSVELNYKMGDPVLFRDLKKKEWKQGVALVNLGKTLYLKYGNWLRRVPIDQPVEDLSKDLEAVQENLDLKEKVDALEEKIQNYENKAEGPASESNDMEADVVTTSDVSSGAVDCG